MSDYAQKFVKLLPEVGLALALLISHVTHNNNIGSLATRVATLEGASPSTISQVAGAVQDIEAIMPRASRHRPAPKKANGPKG